MRPECGRQPSGPSIAGFPSIRVYARTRDTYLVSMCITVRETGSGWRTHFQAGRSLASVGSRKTKIPLYATWTSPRPRKRWQRHLVHILVFFCLNKYSLVIASELRVLLFYKTKNQAIQNSLPPFPPPPPSEGFLFASPDSQDLSEASGEEGG